jgi:alanine racemase
LPLVHISNSAGLLFHPVYGNAVRPGIMCYGLLPTREMTLPFELEPILTLKSQVVQIRELPIGWNISYGRTASCELPTRIAVLRIGYGDGLKRALSNKGSVIIRNERLPIVGTVCMDTTMVAIGDAAVSLDDEVIILGKQGDECITADKHAELAGTINYEILTGISERVKRLYLRDGLIVAES